MVDFKNYFSLLKKYNLMDIPISLDCGYDWGGAEQGAKEISITKEEVYKRIKKDLEFLKNAWRQAE